MVLHFRGLHVPVVVLYGRVESHAVCSWITAAGCFDECVVVPVLELGFPLDWLRHPGEFDRDAEPHSASAFQQVHLRYCRSTRFAETSLVQHPSACGALSMAASRRSTR